MLNNPSLDRGRLPEFWHDLGCGLGEDDPAKHILASGKVSPLDDNGVHASLRTGDGSGCPGRSGSNN